MTADPLPRHPRGRRPAIFDDPASAALLEMLLEMAREQWVLKNRLATLEHYVATEVTAARSPWSDSFRLPADAAARLDAERDTYVKRLLAPIEQL